MTKENPKIIAIIPARGGSKGIIDKNIKPLHGKPLICYTIEEALKSKYLDWVYVSTDSLSIAKTSNTCGARIIERPNELAADDSPTNDTIHHAMDIIKCEYEPDVVILLQPTSPLRNANDIDDAIELFLTNDCNSLISVCKAEHSPYRY